MIIHYETVFTKYIFLRKRTFYKEPVSIEKMFSKTVLNIDNFFDYIYIYIYIYSLKSITNKWVRSFLWSSFGIKKKLQNCSKALALLSFNVL